MIYVPEYESDDCAYIYSTDIIRVLDSQPRNNATIAYKDYYIKSSYIFNTGNVTYSQYSSLPTCISSDRITTDVYYRNDLPSILIIFWSFVLCLWAMWRLFLRMFRRYQ